ncbi:MAG TPA: hypothetical protein DD457_07235 [Gammaproteobacteria bacterium]|nr:hypothetical protein [Gammaproteobacteria bacterium]HBP14981.1 hypothetical protein [Gammaproteobacteria bacterium]|tara:strand:- start:1641 stop:2600 length:960 start_codon:yes stop_codon:yes gene_type:complete
MKRPSVVFEMPDLTIPGEVVSEAEMDFFCEYGFLVKKRFLDPDKLEAALDRIWAHLLAKVPVKPGTSWALSRDDKQTWKDPDWAEMPPHPADGPFQGRQPIEHMRRIVKLHDLGNENYILDLLPNDPGVREVAETILSRDLRAVTRVRGVYLVFPSEPLSEGKLEDQGRFLGPHTDQVCQQLNACGYLEDVNPRNGGFTVYPGSHKRMFREHRYEANWSPLGSFQDTLKEVAETIEPYEIVAEKGSVVFWHGRTVHSVGIHLGADIRWALFADFTQDQPVLTDDEHKDVNQYEWFKDAKLFRSDELAGDDMWRGWRLGR